MKSTKPFNLQAAIAGEPIVTRDGRKARFIAHIPEAESAYRVIAYVEGETRSDEWHDNGEFLKGEVCDDDLFMEVNTRTVYVNFYTSGGALWFSTEQEAVNDAVGTNIAIAIPVEIEA